MIYVAIIVAVVAGCIAAIIGEVGRTLIVKWIAARARAWWRGEP